MGVSFGGRVDRDLMGGHEQLMRKETEQAQKQEWYEHKMRLLKQDKRRRGETIGKLLRCIDDMKVGRLTRAGPRTGAALHWRGSHGRRRQVGVWVIMEAELI